MRDRLRRRIQRTKRQIRHFVFHSILHADDPPHRLALGIAIGTFVTFTPTVGLQMMIVVFLAWLFRANKVVGLPIVWISNPVTIMPIFYTCYRLGRAILGHSAIGANWWMDAYWKASISYGEVTLDRFNTRGKSKIMLLRLQWFR